MIRSAMAGALVSLALAMPAPAADLRVEAELRQLVESLNSAVARHDRQALEQIYAEDFVWVHATGFVDDRKTQIDELLAASAPRAVPPPSFAPPNQLVVIGDTAIFRSRVRQGSGATAWGSTVYVKRGGRWRIVQLQSTTLAPEVTPVAVPEAELARLVGRYDQDNGVSVDVTLEGGLLFMKNPRFPPRLLTPVAGGSYFDKLGDEFVFERDAGGAVTGYRVRFQDGRTAQGRRAR